MKLLGIETSTRACSVAVGGGERILATMNVVGCDRPSDHLMTCLKQCLEVAGLTVDALDAVAVSVGPGSFTGIRVGVTAAKTLAFTLKKPVVPVSSLDVLAANVPAPGLPLWVLVDARKEKLYAACYEPVLNGVPHRVGHEQLIVPGELWPQMQDECLVLGDALVRYGAVLAAALGDKAHCLPPALWVPQASAVCRLGAATFAAGMSVEPHRVTPNYLYSKESDIVGW